MIDIVFATPHIRDTIQTPQYGCLWMASYLRENGFKVDYVDGDIIGLNDDVAKTILKKEPRMVGVSANTLNYQSACELINTIKKLSPKTKVVLGGPHATFTKEGCFKDSLVDNVVVGDGFEPLKIILEKDDGGKLLYGELVDINKLPLPAWDLVDLNKYTGSYPVFEKLSTTSFTSIGCPHRCSFCCAYYKKPRFRKADIFIEELRILYAKGVHEVFLYDEEFNLSISHALEICNAIIDSDFNKKMSFKCEMRCSKRNFNTELFQKMKEANFTVVFWGIESGSQLVLDANKKDLAVEDAIEALKLSSDFGFLNFGFFMTQNIGETWKEAMKTRTFIKKIRKYLKYGQVQIATPLPGSELWERATKEGWMKKKYDSSMFDFSTLDPDRASMSTPWMGALDAELARLILCATISKQYGLEQLAGAIWNYLPISLRKILPISLRRGISGTLKVK